MDAWHGRINIKITTFGSVPGMNLDFRGPKGKFGLQYMVGVKCEETCHCYPMIDVTDGKKEIHLHTMLPCATVRALVNSVS